VTISVPLMESSACSIMLIDSYISSILTLVGPVCPLPGTRDAEAHALVSGVRMVAPDVPVDPLPERPAHQVHVLGDIVRYRPGHSIRSMSEGMLVIISTTQ